MPTDIKQHKRTLWVVAAALAALGLCALLALAGARRYLARFAPAADKEAAWVFIPRGADAGAVRDSITAALGPDFGPKVASIWRGSPAVARGAYRIEVGTTAWRAARNIERGIQTPVRIPLANVRTLDQLADRLAARMEFAPGEFLAAYDSIARSRGMDPDTLATYLFPATYEAYWTESPARLLARMEGAHASFWTPGRRARAAALGLTPAQAYILASIVEEESALADERPAIGRLYLNRLERGMLLQADPTVKYACDDFAARRITGEMLRRESPYNTYRHPGLPPGPIRMVEPATIDGILQSDPHPYIYMCARADFSGRHAFAADYAAHRRNAAAYHRALDSRGITK